MTRADAPLTDIEIAPILLSGLESRLAMAYWALKGLKHSPTDVQEMCEDLESIEPQVALAKKETSDKDNSKHGDNRKKFSGKRKSAPDTNPRKTDNSKGTYLKRQAKLCQKCAKNAPAIKHTHNTSECFKWDDNGAPLNGGGKKGGYPDYGKKPYHKPAYKSAHANEKSMEQMHAMFANWYKKDQTKKKSKNKRSKYDKRYNSDNDTSSSDS